MMSVMPLWLLKDSTQHQPIDAAKDRSNTRPLKAGGASPCCCCCCCCPLFFSPVSGRPERYDGVVRYDGMRMGAPLPSQNMPQQSTLTHTHTHIHQTPTTNTHTEREASRRLDPKPWRTARWRRATRRRRSTRGSTPASSMSWGTRRSAAWRPATCSSSVRVCRVCEVKWGVGERTRWCAQGGRGEGGGRGWLQMGDPESGALCLSLEAHHQSPPHTLSQWMTPPHTHTNTHPHHHHHDPQPCTHDPHTRTLSPHHHPHN
jgi:hypothetical protein